MKRTSTLFAIALVFTSFLFVGCNGSVKGKWSDDDLKQFRTNMAGLDLSALGDNKTAWVECYYKKCEATFSSYRAADSDIAGCEKIALECNQEVLSNGSVLGNWSDVDKAKFRSDMNGIQELASLGDKKAAWIECYLVNCEAAYSSYVMADSDEKGCEEIAIKCSNEFM